MTGTYPLSGFDSPTEFYFCATASSPTCRSMVEKVRPFRGLFPFNVSTSGGATYLQQDPTRWLRCAHRVSHPLDALLPTWPTELISSRIRSWDSPFEAFFPTRCRTPSQGAGSLMRFRLRSRMSSACLSRVSLTSYWARTTWSGV